MPRAVPTAPLLSASFIVFCSFLAAASAGCRTASLRRAPEIPHVVSFNADAYKTLSLKALKGKVVLLFFWSADDAGSWNTLPEINRLYAAYRPRGLEVIGVHTPSWESLKGAVPYVSENTEQEGMVFPVIMDEDNRIKEAYGTLLVPSVYLVDRNGFIRSHYVGKPDGRAIETTLDQLLIEDGRPAPADAAPPVPAPKRFKGYEEGFQGS